MTNQAISNGVIVAENDAQMRGLIRSVLVHAKQQVFPVVDGLEALQMARQFKPRLFLLDFAMPRMNGVETCEALRQIPGFQDVPIVMLTGHTEARLVASARKAGASGYITKPFRPNALLARLAAWLNIPPAMLAKESMAGNASGPDLGAAAVEWKQPPGRAAATPVPPALANGLEVMRILRASAKGY